MKKFLKVTAIVIAVIALLLYGYLEYSTAKNNAPPTEQALSMMQSSDGVDVSTQDDWVIIQPQDT